MGGRDSVAAIQQRSGNEKEGKERKEEEVKSRHLCPSLWYVAALLEIWMLSNTQQAFAEHC